MKILKNKLVLLAPIIALLVVFIFSLTLFPSVQPTPKNLPIAIVNEDQGIKPPNQTEVNMGQNIVEMIRNNAIQTKKDSSVEWIEVKTEEKVRIGMNDQKYYAALVIPKDFSAKQASLVTPSPSSPEFQIYINQGMNTAASTMAGQVLDGVVETMNQNVRTQILDKFESQGATLTPKQAESLVVPISKKVMNVNEIGTNSANGNSPVSLFQPLWMASLASAAIIFIVVRKLHVVSRKENLSIKVIQILMGAIVALVVGFGLTALANGVIGISIPHFLDTALFLSITSFSFYLMISAVLSLLGIKGMPIFILLLFFGAPLLAMAPEMMSTFYRDWIYSWLPMRFMVEGLRELFFFGKELSWSTSVSSLVWIGIVSIMVVLLSSLKVNIISKVNK